ncbi:TetR/AcrR family transcriptional regulator [Edaphobacter modestus]|uniref:TetR family transcriptional regulator n=1 Tax=Edaphobacter modestus TaxID=388466 RepID=A0A4Q7YVK3_9BACT|nr:TetR/AcrR family transcriptional regulator [Edaphobacter modestus]RZU41384.1 TetR family transcriptional regulator [Edaphobacter modestus]
MSEAVLTLRDRQTAATREQILEIAMHQLGQGPRGTFSHESIAEAAGLGARTVYRYFPDRASLLQALWIRLREATKTRFPETEEEILPLARSVFEEFEANEPLVRAVITSPAGTEVRERGGTEGRAAFSKSLSSALEGLPETEKDRIIAVFVSIYSAPFWQLLRDRGLLSGADAQEAVAWTLEALIQAAKNIPKTEQQHKSRKVKDQ